MEPHEIERAAAIWDSGNYPALATRLAPAAHRIATIVGPGEGKTALDLATGTGNLARTLARRNWDTTGLDLAPGLLAHAEKAARAEDLDITWTRAPLDDLPNDDNSADLVTSSFGLIFAPDPPAALAEARRVLRPGGTMALTVWPVDGHMAHMSATMEPFVNYPLTAPFRWGDTDILRTWLEPGFTDVAISNGFVPWQFPSSENYIDFLLESSPGHVTTKRAAGNSAGRLQDALLTFAEAIANDHNEIDLSLEFLTVTALRRNLIP